jgi:hypothetical protein
MPIYPQSDAPSVMDNALQAPTGLMFLCLKVLTRSRSRLSRLYGMPHFVRITCWRECSARLNNSNQPTGITLILIKMKFRV